MAFAAIHVVVALVLFGGPLLGIVRAGVGSGPFGWSSDMPAAFWFLVWAWPLFLLGYVARWVYAKTERLPAALGWGLISVAAASVAFLPVSGLWLFIPLGALTLLAAAQGPVEAKPEERRRR